MTRLRILELPHDRDPEGHFIPGPVPFVLVVDKVSGPEAALMGGTVDLDRAAAEIGARGVLVFAAGLTVELPDDPAPEPITIAAHPGQFPGLAEAIREAQERERERRGYPDVTADGVFTRHQGRAGG